MADEPLEPTKAARNLLELPNVPMHVSIAYAYVEDASAGRLANGRGRMYTRSPLIQLCFLIQIHPALKYGVFLSALVFSLLVLEDDIDSSKATWTTWIELICIFVFVVDTVLKAAYMGLSKYASKTWHILQVALVVMYIFDWLLFVAGGITPRFSRPLRPCILLLRNRGLRRIFEILILMLPTLGKLFACAAGFLLFFAVIGVVAFMEDYHGPVAEQHIQDDILVGSFDNVAKAFVRLFVLYTTENYPDIMEPVYSRTKWGFLYFCSFLYLGVFFVNALILALIVSVYFRHQEKQVLNERKKEWKGLIKAFASMDQEGVGYLNLEKWGQLYHALKPLAQPGEILFTFELLDRDKTGKIDCIDFLDLTEILKLKMMPFTEKEFKPRFPRLTAAAKRVIRSKHFSRAVQVCIMLNFVATCAIWRGMSKETERAIHGISFMFCCLFVLELVTRLIAVGIDKFVQRKLNMLDVGMVAPAWVLLVLAMAGVAPPELALAANLMLFVRVFWTTRSARLVLVLLLRVLPVMLYLTAFLLVMMYMFAVIGLELFQQSHADPPQAAYYARFDCGIGFESMGCAFLALFQIITTSNWHDIMNSVIRATSYGAAVYFLSFFLVLYILLDLLVAVTIEAFLTARRNLEDVDPDELAAALVQVPVPSGQDGQDDQDAAETDSDPDAAAASVPETDENGTDDTDGDGETDFSGLGTQEKRRPTIGVSLASPINAFTARARRVIAAKKAWQQTLATASTQRGDKKMLYRVTKKRGEWRKELAADTDSLAAMNAKDVDKLSKLAGNELTQLYVQKAARRKTLEAQLEAKKDEFAKFNMRQRTLSRISPILKLYSETSFVHAEEELVAPTSASGSRRLTTVFEERPGSSKFANTIRRGLSRMQISLSHLEPDPDLTSPQPPSEPGQSLWSDEAPKMDDTDEDSDSEAEGEEKKTTVPAGWFKVRRALLAKKSNAVAPASTEASTPPDEDEASASLV